MGTSKSLFIMQRLYYFRSTFLFVFFMLSYADSKAQNSYNKPLLDSIYSYICEKNIHYPDIVIRQVILETGWLRTPFLMKRNNLFGFRKQNYMTFGTWQESVDFYKSWQDKNYRPEKEDYKNFLRRMKFGTSHNYFSYLNKIPYQPPSD